MNRGQKFQRTEIHTDNKALKWIENFWYHHKWTFIIVSFFVIVGIICTLQTCSKKEEDIKIAYAGPAYLTLEHSTNIESVLEFVMPEDFDKNGKKDASLLLYQTYSEEQIREIEAQTDAAGNAGYVDRNHSATNNKNFYQYIQTGDSAICLVDSSIYETLKTSNRLLPVSEALGYNCERSADGYGIKLGDLDIYSAYGAMKVLPENTVLCILSPLVAGKTSKADMYECEKAMFRALVEFKSES